MNKSNSTGVARPMTGAAAARIQSVTAHASGGRVNSGSFAARAQAAAARNAGVTAPRPFGGSR